MDEASPAKRARFLKGLVNVTTGAGRGNEWWRHALIYQIYPRSFKDTSGNGVGDLKGVREQLDYLSSLNVSALWLSPFYKSPMKDFGYDISDFIDIDPTFGTLDDFKDLISDMQNRGMRLILDFVPNHSSDEHVWFTKSAARVEPYTDYYVWAKPRNENHSKPQPPNNWLSVFGGSAWQYHEERREYYLHQFAKEQPDLNFRNPRVLTEMQSVLTFWLELGVSGFRVDAAPHILEDELLRDEPRSEDGTALEDEYAYLNHVHTHGLTGVFDIIAAFRRTLDEYAANSDSEPRLLMAEVYDTLEKTMRYYGEPESPLADFPFNFLLISEIKQAPNATELRDLVLRWTHKMPEGACANWVLGNHDQSRVASRVGHRLVDAMNMVALLLPGVAVTYYGEEIGMEDVKLNWHETVDPAGRNAGPERYTQHSRDPQRSPMQWSDQQNAGFSNSNSTWLPVHENHLSGVSVEAQTQGDSHLNIYRSIVKARDFPAVKYGDLDVRVIGDVFAFTRVLKNEGVLVAVNLGNEEVFVNLTEFKNLPEFAKIYICNLNYTDKDNKTVDTAALHLDSQDAVVLTFILPHRSKDSDHSESNIPHIETANAIKHNIELAHESNKTSTSAVLSPEIKKK